jgi:mannose-6-phosphate isomerase
MLLLRNPIQPYAWGPTDGIAALVGSPPTGGPEAELWVGTHRRGRSVVAAGEHEGRTLAEVIAADPARWLGRELADAGATELPFLLKVLAIAEPLSLQAHPSAEQAAAGFAREQAAGIDIDAPERTYRDRCAKPEALVAIRPSWALCGFRDAAEESAGLLGRLGVAALDPFVTTLAAAGSSPAAGAAAHRALLAWLLRLQGDERTELAAAIAAAPIVAAAPVPPPSAPPVDPFSWVRELARTHPDDPLALAPLLLNLVPVAPGEAVHLPAGNLHAYLRGAGVEIMASSDNVLRGGLTPKHVDVDELLAILRFEPGLPDGPRRTSGRRTSYEVGEEAFALAVIEPGAERVALAPSAPSLLLATGGPVQLRGPDTEVVLDRGIGAFVPPDDGPFQVTGTGWLWWATTGGGLPA